MEELISSLESLARQFYAEKKTLLFHRYNRPATAKCDGLLDMREQFLSTKIKWYLIIAITPSRSWVGHIMSVTLVETQQFRFQWYLIICQIMKNTL